MDMDKDSILRAAELMAEQLDEDYEPDPGILPQPVPTSVGLSTYNGSVVLAFTTPIGQNTFFLDPQTATKIANGLQELVKVMQVT